MKQICPSPFDYFRVTGSERLEWLQGQITQDLRGLQAGEWARTAVLTATGQMAADGGVWIFDREIILGLDRFAAADAFQSLESRIIMEDVRLEKMPPAVTSLGNPAPEAWSLPVEHVAGACFDTFAPAEGDLLTPNDYNVLRVEAAIPLAGIDYDAKTLAMELGDHFVETRVAFDKGCYVGQEVVERIRSRGHTNRKWVGLRAPEPIEPGNEARITSYGLSPRLGHIALAFVPRSGSEIGTRYGNAVVCALPFNSSL